MSDVHHGSPCAPASGGEEIDRFRVDELLEVLYYLDEEKAGGNQRVVVERLTEHDPDPALVLDAAVRMGVVEPLADGDPDAEVRWTKAGAARARGVIRRHRLAEILFSQVLEVPEGEVEPSACEMEHILSTGVTDSVCTFLGHPPRCPHGREIPPGDCCRRFSRKVQPIVVPLAELELARPATIVFISPKGSGRLARLADLGVLPGAPVRLVQRQPAFVIEVGETTLALESEIVREIYVRREDRSSA